MTGLVLVGLVPLAAPAEAAAPTIVVSRSSVIGGESVTVKGNIGQKRARQVVLQRKVGTKWVKVTPSRSTATGAYTFLFKPPTKLGSKAAMRVIAPKVKISGKTYPQITTGGRTITTIAQGATMILPSVVPQGSTFTVTGKFTPARLARAAVVQKPVNGKWVSATAQRFQSSAGQVTFQMSLPTQGEVRLRVLTLAKDGAPAKASAESTVEVIVPAPSGLQATPGNAKVDLSWNAVNATGVTGYNVYRSTDPNTPAAAWTKVTPSPVAATSYAVTELTNNTTYYFAVTSVTTGDESAFSSTASAKPVQPADTTPPGVPANVQAAPGDGSAQVSWNAVVAGDLAGYRVYQATNANGPWTLRTPNAISATTFPATSLTNGTAYFFQVTSIDTSGNESARSSTASATPAPGADETPPPVPGAVVASAGSGSANLTWGPSNAVDLAGYKVYRSANASGPWTLLTANPTTELAYAASGLSNGQTYYFGVAAIDTSGNESDKSVSGAVTPTAPPAGWAGVSTGLQHTCAIGSNGTLWCWGLNRNGQLGNATGIDTGNAYTSPVRVGAATNWTSVSVGDDFTCGIQSPGTLSCWGKNNYGQLGTATNSGTENPTSAPAAVGDGTNWTSVSAGSKHACGIRTTGEERTVSCWGLNTDGQLGRTANINTLTPNPAPVAVDAVTSWTSVSAGADQTCGIRTAGSNRTVWCWGSNVSGQLGNTSATLGTFTPTTTPTLVIGGFTTWTGVSAGDGHTCGSLDGSIAKCWGANEKGELGKAANDDPNGSPSAVAGSGWLSITAGGGHTCGTKADGVYCFGQNDKGQLGKAANAAVNATPTKVATSAAAWTFADAGGSSACALTTASAIRCWGLNEFGQLGNPGDPVTAGTENPNPTPLLVPLPN